MGTKKFTQSDARGIRDLFVGRQIVSAENDTLTLDDGTVLRVRANDGCGGCYSGNYEVKAVDTFDQIITNVRLADEVATFDGSEGDQPHIYSIFVYAGKKSYARTILTVAGDDGNGYYGTGYEIYVTRV